MFSISCVKLTTEEEKNLNIELGSRISIYLDIPFRLSDKSKLYEYDSTYRLSDFDSISCKIIREKI